MTSKAADILEDFPKKKVAGRPSTYPWDEWTDGEIRELIWGVHFDCHPVSLRSLIHLTARKRGLKATTSILTEEGKEGNMIIHFRQKEEK